MGDYILKPKKIKAMKWEGSIDSLQDIQKFLKECGHPGDIEAKFTPEGRFSAVTILGTVNPDAFQVENGDYIVFDGHLFSMRIDDFLLQFDPV